MLERLGRQTRANLGKGVLVAYVVDRQRKTAFFPVDQSELAKHPRCPSGYDNDGKQIACVSKSASCYGELCKYGGFRWK